MSSSLESLMLYVGKNFFDRTKKVFNLGFIVRKPLFQIFKSMGFHLIEMDRDETKRFLEEFSMTSGITITHA